MLRRIMFTLLAMVSSMILFADLEFEADYNYDLVGPAYGGETVEFISDTLWVENMGSTEDFTLHLETSEIPDGWTVLWCHEYEDALCHFPNFPWTFTFLRNSTIGIDLSIIYNSSPGELVLDLYWESSTVSEVSHFTFRTEDSVSTNPEIISSGVFLNQNYPNPFNPETTLSFTLSQSDQAVLNIYNVRGELIKTIAEGYLEAGDHSYLWNGKDKTGNTVPSGLYFYRLRTSTASSTAKMILMK